MLTLILIEAIDFRDTREWNSPEVDQNYETWQKCNINTKLNEW